MNRLKEYEKEYENDVCLKEDQSKELSDMRADLRDRFDKSGASVGGVDWYEYNKRHEYQSIYMIKKFQRENIVKKYAELHDLRAKIVDNEKEMRKKYERLARLFLNYHLDILCGALIVNPAVHPKTWEHQEEFKQIFEKKKQLEDKYYGEHKYNKDFSWEALVDSLDQLY